MDLCCTFHASGFLTESRYPLVPCGVAYCKACIVAGPPFKTRLSNGKGLGFPKADPQLFPNYICEACQVRSIIDRELEATTADKLLLMLERMRQLDTMHKWAEGTVSKYGGQIQRIRRFETVHKLDILCPRPIYKPSTSKAIPLMWTQLNYTFTGGKNRDQAISYNAARNCRSAASFYFNWDMQVSFPGQAMRDFQKRGVVVPYAAPTDEMGYTLQNGGMARRMGTAVESSWALQHKHIQYINDRLEQIYSTTTNAVVRHEAAAAGAANLVLWLGWLRGGEAFALKRTDIRLRPPEDAPEYGLPVGWGFVDMRLLAETKSSAHKVADVVVAFTSFSGLSLGKWLERLLAFPSTDNIHLFSTPNKPRWDSGYFRRNFAWPLLEDMRMAGEPSLMAFTDEPGHRIRDKVWSCHSWRRGVESFVRKKRSNNHRAATKDEQYQHARWRKKRDQTAEDIDLSYTEMDLESRLAITMLCC